MTEEEKKAIQEELKRSVEYLEAVRKGESEKRKKITERLVGFHEAVEQRVAEFKQQDELQAQQLEEVFQKNSERIDNALEKNDVAAIQKLLKEIQG
jgi:DNA helicase IV